MCQILLGNAHIDCPFYLTLGESFVVLTYGIEAFCLALSDIHQCEVPGTFAHVNVGHTIVHTSVLLENDLVDLWIIYCPVCVRITRHAEAVSFKLGDGEKVRDPTLIQPHIEDAQVALRGCHGDASITVPAENCFNLSDILEVLASKHGVICSRTIQVQLVFVQRDALDRG